MPRRNANEVAYVKSVGSIGARVVVETLRVP
jgi:hypothetical protein